MVIREIIEEIENDISNAKNNGNRTIDADKLLLYLDDIKNSAAIQAEDERDKKRFDHEIKLEEYKANIQCKIVDYTTISQSESDMFKSILETAQSALKSAILINGGAAIALLAFIGKFWSDALDKCTIGFLIFSISFFAFGALFSAAGAGLRYLSQDHYAQSFREEVKSFKLGEPVSLPESKARKFGDCFRNWAILSTVSSYVFFIIGIISAAKAFYNHFF